MMRFQVSTAILKKSDVQHTGDESQRITGCN